MPRLVYQRKKTLTVEDVQFVIDKLPNAFCLTYRGVYIVEQKLEVENERLDL